jgi:rubrerythrin
MKKEPSEMGLNRTGVAMSPFDGPRLVEASDQATPAPGDESELAGVRRAYAEDAAPLGSMPPPASMKGAAKAAVKLLTGEQPNVLLDRLGERLAFERSGVRLYQAVLSRFEVFEPDPAGPPLSELRRILGEEARHFELLSQVMEQLGGDPTAQTPAADVAGVESMGILQIIDDPRTSPSQVMHALLLAELADRDGWSLLVQLFEAADERELAERFRQAMFEEEEHLLLCRHWLASLTFAAAGLEPKSF